MKVRKRFKKFLIPILILSMVLVSVTGFSGNKNTPVYEFEEDEDGQPNGWGVCEYPDGTIYEGEMSHGYFEGLGLCFDPNGDEGEVIRAAYFNQSENPDSYNYAIEYYPDSGRVVFSQNEYDVLDGRWVVTMGEDPSTYCTVQRFAPGKRRRSEEIERLRFDYYYDGTYDVVFMDEKGKQVDNSEIATYYSDGILEMGFLDDEEEINGIWLDEYEDRIVLCLTINGSYNSSQIVIRPWNYITLGTFIDTLTNGMGIQYYNDNYYLVEFVGGKMEGDCLNCDFINNAYYLQQYESGVFIGGEQLTFPQGVSVNTEQEAADTSGSGRSGRKKAGTSDAAETGLMWIIGEGEAFIDTDARASQNAASYAEQIDTIIKNFEDYNAEHSNLVRHPMNGSYRMFELLCVIAEELDTSGTYANAVAESAMNRYKETDAGLSKGNLQTVNSLYRSAEILGSIMYELGGEASIAEIENIYSYIQYAEITAYNFLDCEGDAMVAVYSLLYEIVPMLDLPDSNMEKIQTDYLSWENDLQEVERESNKVIYSAGMRRYTGSLYRIYELLEQTALGLDVSGSYSADIRNIEETIGEAVETWKNDSVDYMRLEQYYYSFDGSLFDANTYLLSIIARLLDPDAS